MAKRERKIFPAKFGMKRKEEKERRRIIYVRKSLPDIPIVETEEKCVGWRKGSLLGMVQTGECAWSL